MSRDPGRPSLAVLREIVKGAVARSHIPPGHGLVYLLALLEMGRWCRRHAAGTPDLRKNRELYAFLEDTVIRGEAIDYLEFGVHRGSTISKWMEVNRNAASRFVGFDTFTGLPEEWRGGVRSTAKGAFDTDGREPELDDPRVRFVKGLFQETLGGFLERFRAQGRLVVHCDADLYSSTLFVLTTLHPQLVPGSLIVFDEFDSPLHEFRAFCDYVSSFRVRFEVLARTGPLMARLAVRILA